MENIMEFFKGFNIQEIISLIAVVWFVTNGKFKNLNTKYKKIIEDLKDIKHDVKSIDTRLSRLEGRFEERGQWESRDKKIGE